MKLPKNINLIINHNEHKGYYKTLQQHFEDTPYLIEDISKEDYKKCLELDELWVIHWYPITPISFHRVCSYSLEKCIELALEIEKEVK